LYRSTGKRPARRRVELNPLSLSQYGSGLQDVPRGDFQMSNEPMAPHPRARIRNRLGLINQM